MTFSPPQTLNQNMDELKPLESRIICDNAWEFVHDLVSARLGYELVKIANDPRHAGELRLSVRYEGGIGIDSDLPAPFYVPKQFDYHRISAFHTRSSVEAEWRTPRVSERVVYLMPDRVLDDLAELEATFNTPISRIIIFNYANAETYSGFERSVKRNPSKKIDALLNNPSWRADAAVHSKESLRNLREELDNEFSKDVEHGILAALDDISKGQRVVGSGMPVLNSIKHLLELYERQMAQAIPPA